MSASPPRILILSHGKSGSTGLYFKIKNSLEACAGIFEPLDFSAVAPHLETPQPLLAKALLPDAGGFLEPLLAAFPTRILLVRDPRDVLVSALLYTGAYALLWHKPEAEIHAALALLQSKQAQPRSVSLSELFPALWGGNALEAVCQDSRAISRLFIELADRPGFCVCRYEDFISGNLAGLERYLGFSLAGSADVAEDYQRVVRTRGSGAWRDWFTAEDVVVFQPLLRDYMQRFGYDCEDWALAATPHIEPRHAAEYVHKLIAERRAQEGLPPIGRQHQASDAG